MYGQEGDKCENNRFWSSKGTGPCEQGMNQNKVVSQYHIHQLKAMCGTPEFLSPEVVNYDAIDTATGGFSTHFFCQFIDSFLSDMWSVGVICYVLLSGYSPFVGDSDAETSSNITRLEKHTNLII